MAYTNQVSAITDIVANTLRDLGKDKFELIGTNLRSCITTSHLFKKDRIDFASGYGFQRNVQYAIGTNARHAGPFSTDVVDIPTLSTNCRVDFIHADASYGFGYQEVLANRGDARIVDILLQRRAGAIANLCEELEAKFWSLPDASSTTDPFGLPYWIVYNASTGFTGGNPSGYTSVGGINPSTITQWKNYSFNYAAITAADWLSKARVMHRKLQWRAPVKVPSYSKSEDTMLRIYTDADTEELMVQFCESRNENLGYTMGENKATTVGGNATGMGASGDTITFKRSPIIEVPYLTDTGVSGLTKPMYFVDSNTFFAGVMKGDFFRETVKPEMPNQRNMGGVFYDISYNYMCTNRRRNGVCAQ